MAYIRCMVAPEPGLPVISFCAVTEPETDAFGPNTVGSVFVTRNLDGAWDIIALFRSGIPPAAIDVFARWARTSVKRALEHGDPGAHGWQQSDQVPDRWSLSAAANAFC